MKSFTSLVIPKPSKYRFDVFSDAANGNLPSMSSVYSNINAPSTADLGGSLGDKATGLNDGATNAFQTYKNQASNLPKATDYYSSLMQQNGIPQLQATSAGLQKNVNDLQDSIYQTTPNVSANTANSLVTDSQRQGMIDAQNLPKEQLLEPLTSHLGQVNSSLATQEANIAGQVGAMNTQNAQQLGVGAMGVTVAQDNAARSMTGYTQDADNQLQGLLKKMDITGQLDQAEWKTLSDLATQKQAYQNTLGQISAQSKADIQKSQAGIVTLNPAQTAYNTANGNHFTAGY